MSDTQQNSIYTQRRFYFMTLDPVHVGTGGYRLGRVDMTVAREPGTSLPKIPGTSLAGAARSYAAMFYGKLEAAGQHKGLAKLAQEDKRKCPILYTFGSPTETGGGLAGCVSIGDARLLFFPVHSMAGPVWVSTPELVIEALGANSLTPPQRNGEAFGPTDKGEAVTSLLNWDKPLNLGWLLLDVKSGMQITPSEQIDGWQEINNRIVLVTPKLLSQIVNSNLEVRTSVSIDAMTGAAEKGALFTYEAIPRAAWLFCDVIEDDYPRFVGMTFPKTDKQAKREANGFTDNAGDPLSKKWERPLDVVATGLEIAEFLGVGGMGTRGFGRIKTTGQRQVTR